MSDKKLKVCARWIYSHNGKSDYDAYIISLSSRYLTYPSSNASSSISLNFGSPNEWGYDDSITLIEQEFQGAGEIEVKRQVEDWAQNEFNKIHEALKSIYPGIKDEGNG